SFIRSDQVDEEGDPQDEDLGAPRDAERQVEAAAEFYRHCKHSEHQEEATEAPIAIGREAAGDGRATGEGRATPAGAASAASELESATPRELRRDPPTTDVAWATAIPATPTAAPPQLGLSSSAPARDPFRTDPMTAPSPADASLGSDGRLAELDMSLTDDAVA